MGLKQNGRLIHQMPLRHRGLAGFEYADTNKSQNRNIFAGDAGFNPVSGTPNGHRSPSSWVLPQKNGGISSYTGLRCVGSLNANGAMGVNLESLINDNDGSLIAVGSLLASISLSMNGSGALNSGLLALLNMTATLQASGDINGALGALASVISTLTGDGYLNLIPYSTGNLAATITTATELSPKSLSEAVWSAIATENNVLGTMGEKLNSAGGSNSPTDIANAIWDSLRTDYNDPDSMGLLMKEIAAEIDKRLKKTEFIALK